MGKITADEFAERVSKATNGRITIVKETYTGTHKKVTAYCNIHKIYFEVYEAKFLYSKKNRANCPECYRDWTKKYGQSKIIPFSEMLNRFKEAYGNKFVYDESSYHGRKELMKVHCNDCGEDFEITPEHHLKYNNGGCPNCHKTIIVKCSKCGKEMIVDRHCDKNGVYLCNECKLEKKKQILIKCSFCGLYHRADEKCKNELCNMFSFTKSLKILIPFGFDYSTIGTLNYINEFEKASEVLLKEYFDNKLSAKSIFEKFNCLEYISSEWHLRYFIKEKLKRNLRSISEALQNALESGTRVIQKFSNKVIKYYTWENKQVFLRSSYELDFAKLLDEKNISYDVECLRIKYFDTLKNKERIAIPDFYLIETNTIVEIKSAFTLNIVNMLDKIKAYKQNGYNFKLIYEHKETDIYTIEQSKCIITDKLETPTKTKIGHKKWKWMNNGTELFKVPIDEIDDYLKRGFKFGHFGNKKK